MVIYKSFQYDQLLFIMIDNLDYGKNKRHSNLYINIKNRLKKSLNGFKMSSIIK